VGGTRGRRNGALLTALGLALLGVALASWAEAASATLFEHGARLPPADAALGGGVPSARAVLPFVLLGGLHVLAVFALSAPGRLAWKIVAADALGVVAVGLAAGDAALASIVVLGLALAVAAGGGHGLGRLAMPRRRGATR